MNELRNHYDIVDIIFSEKFLFVCIEPMTAITNNVTLGNFLWESINFSYRKLSLVRGKHFAMRVRECRHIAVFCSYFVDSCDQVIFIIYILPALVQRRLAFYLFWSLML